MAVEVTRSSGSVTKLTAIALMRYDSYITDPLKKLQFEIPLFGAPFALLQAVASTIAVLVTGIFAMLAAVAGGICKIRGNDQLGNDLLQAATGALFGVEVLDGEKYGALRHAALAGISLVNLATCALLIPTLILVFRSGERGN